MVQSKVPRALSAACGQIDSALRRRRTEGRPARVLAERAAIAILPSCFSTFLGDDEGLGGLDQRFNLLKEPSASIRSHACSTRRAVRYSPCWRISLSFSTRKVSDG